MGADIDQLNIKIEADAQKAHSSVDTLINKLGRLNSALGGINTSNLTSLSNGVQKLANSMQSMKNVGTADFTRLAKNIQKMGQLDSKQLGKAAGSIHRFANSLGSLDKISVSDNAAQIGELAKGISRLGYKSSTQAIENIPKLAKAMRQLMTELSKAPRVSQNLIQMTNALANLSRTGAASGRAANSLSKSLNTYTASTHKASKGSFSLASAIGKIYATYWMLFRAVGVLKKSIDISSQLTEVQNVVDTTFGDMSYKVEEFAKTSIQQFGMSELSLKQYASRFQAMGSAMGISSSSIGNANSFLNKQTKGYVGLSNSMADVSLNLTKLTADMASFYNVEQAVVAEDLEAIFTGQTRPLRQYGLDLTQATLQEWALKNGIDANVASMSQAEKTMLRYQYVLANTGAAQGDFAKTANTWANQIRILKQNFEQLGSIVGRTLINALKPLVQALNSVMGHLIAFAETVSNALGKIFGWKFEKGSGGAGTAGLATDMEDAAGSAGGLADKTGKAAKNIDKMKAGLRAFDELKTISMPDNSNNSGSGSGSGSGSSGGSSGTSGSGGQWVRQESMFEDYQSSIDSLYGLGSYIRDALIGAMKSINWNSIYEKARGFGSGLAKFLNGLFAGNNGVTLFGALGTTIAGALNTVLHGLDSFGRTFDWTQFGSSIADGVNNFFSTFNFDLLADTISTWADGILNACISFVDSTNWEQIGKKISEFLSNIDYGKLLADAIELSVSLINAAEAFVKGLIIKFDPLKILKSIKDGLSTVDWSEAFDAFTNLTLLIPGINITFAALKFLGVKDKIVEFIDKIENIDYNAILEIGVKIKTKANDLWKKFKKSWGVRTADFLLKIASIPRKLWEAFKKGWEEFKNDPIEFVLSTPSKAKDLWDNFKRGWGTKTVEFLLKIASKPKDLWDNFKKSWGKTKTAEFLLKISSKAKDLWDNFKKSWGAKTAEFLLKIASKASDLWEDFKKNLGRRTAEFYLKIASEANELWENFKSSLGRKTAEFYLKIASKASDLWEDFKTKWGESRTANFLLSITSKASDLWEKFKTSWGKTRTASFLLKIGSTATSLWNTFKNSWGINKKVSIGIKFAKNALNNLWNSVKNFFSGKSIGIGAGSSATTKADGGVFSNGSWKPIQKYAAGGIPNYGQMFIAREAGPELVGTLGGHTAVMNNDQIVASVSAGVYQAVKAAMGSGQPVNVTFRVEGDPNGIFKVTREQAQEFFNRTGEPAFPI